MSKPASSLSTFFRELRRRKVFQVAVVYAVVGWLLIQITQTCFPALHLPAWTVTFIVVLVFIGFPIALIVAWALELTPEGVKLTEALEGEAQASEWHTGRRIELVLIGLLAIAVIYLFIRPDREQTPTDILPSETVNSIAVLPFVDMSPEKDQEYFCDGVAEELLNVLAKVKGLRVAARTSSFSFKGKDVDISTIGRNLNVESVLEGSVRKAGDRVRITAQLVKAADGFHLWSETYDRNLDDIFEIQDDISRSIVTSLRIKLLGVEESLLVKSYTEDIEAHDLYLKGRHFMHKSTEEGLEKALEFFKKAIAKDPEFALAYAGLAHTYDLIVSLSYLPSKEIFPLVKENAKKALEIDPTLAEALTLIADVKYFYDWDWLTAEKYFKRAIELNPGYALTHQWYSLYLMTMGRTEESLAEIKIAQQLDPLSIAIKVIVGKRLYSARQYDQAIEQLLKIVELDPNTWRTRFFLGVAYREKGMYEEAIAELQKALTLSDGSPFVKSELGYTYAVSGKRSKAQKVLEELTERSKQGYVGPGEFACVYIGLGDNDRAFEWLEQGFEERDPRLIFLKVWPVFDPLRDDPRFTAMLKKMKLDNLQ